MMMTSNMAKSYMTATARVRALTAYKDFLTLRKDADPDIPVLKQALRDTPAFHPRHVDVGGWPVSKDEQKSIAWTSARTRRYQCAENFAWLPLPARVSLDKTFANANGYSLWPTQHRVNP
jgi:hypothetical protein